MTDAEKIARASDARALLDHVLIREALASVRDASVRMFKAAKTADELRRARDLLTAGNDFVLYLTTIVNQGDAAARNLEPGILHGRKTRPWERPLKETA